MKPLIAVIGANPAWQKTLFFKELTPGKVNRAFREENYPSGKGVNFCRALRCSGLGESIIFQFAGGVNGELHCQALEQSNYSHRTIRTEGATRNCITCLDECGNMTELIAPSQKITAEEAEKFLAELAKELPRTDLLAIAGSLPDKSDPELYCQAAALAAENSIPLLADTLAGLDGILSVKATAILKVNKEEFFKITGEDEIFSAHRCAQKRYPGKVFAITDGADKATLSAGNKCWSYTLPEIQVVNPLGAGDTASAVMSALIAAKVPFHEAFLQALAAASANCMTANAGDFNVETSRELAEKITVESINLW